MWTRSNLRPGPVSLSLLVCCLIIPPTTAASAGTPADPPGREAGSDQPPTLAGSAVEIAMFKRQLLQLMGLTERPPAKRGSNALPAYIWDVYDELVERAASTHYGTTDEPFSGGPRPRYNTVRSFFPTGTPSSPTTLRFDLSGLPSTERWLSAELRVPLHHLFPSAPSPVDSANDSLAGECQHPRPDELGRFVRVNLYLVVNESIDVRHLIDTRLIGASAHPWITFDVLKTISRTAAESDVVKLAVEFVLISPSGRSVVSRFLAALSDWDKDADRSASLTMYGLDDSGTDRARQPRWRRRAGIGTKAKLGSLGNKRPLAATGQRPSRRRKGCGRRRLVIRFEDLNWQDWILAPQEYEAYYCSGRCTYPFSNDHHNATNHAVVQALVNLVSPGTAPRPCCVPTDTSPISMLYTDVRKNVVIKNYPDMVVEGCGCR